MPDSATGRRRTGLAAVFSFRGEDHTPMGGERFFAFVDGVFAIITTLLVLDLRLPEHIGSGELGHELWELHASFAAYGIGFLQAFGGWAAFHRLAHRVRSVDHWMVVILGMALAVAALVPFSSAVLARSFGDPANFKVAMALVTSVGAISTGFYLAGTYYALRRGLAVEGTTDEHIAFGRKLGIASLIGWIVAVGVSFVAPWAALPMVVWGYGVVLLPNRIDEFPVRSDG